MRHLVTAIALAALCACGETVGDHTTGTTHAASASSPSSAVSSNTSTNVTSSVTSDSSTSVTSSNNVGSTTTQSSTSNSTSTCSTEVNGKRCEIACTLPQVAQCVQRASTSGPTCFCK